MSVDDENVDSVGIFVGDRAGPEQYVCFFEDDGETGYLYVSDRTRDKIVKHLQIYDNAQDLNVQESDVSVIWSADCTKCAVVIWGGVRGVIDLAKGIEVRAKVLSRMTPAICDAEWLKGFGVP